MALNKLIGKPMSTSKLTNEVIIYNYRKIRRTILVEIVIYFNYN